VRFNRLIVSGVLLSVGNASSALLGFLRNVVIARLISVEDFGIAATFALTLQIIEMSSNLAIDRLLVQSKDGDNADLQATAQAFQFVRGAMGAVIMFMASGFIAKLFDLEYLTWAFQILAIVPLLNAVSHSDITRFQRKMKFSPKVIQDTAPQVLTLVLSAPLAYYFGDYRVVLYLVIIQVFTSIIISHILAERRYKWAWNKAYVRLILSFGWPLLLNSFLMIGIFQADKLIIGSLFNMETLGWFSAAFTLTLVPTLLLTKVAQSFFLPILAKHQNFSTSSQYISIVILLTLVIFGVATAVGFSIAGPAIFLLVFGQKFAAGVSVLALLGLMQAIRVVKMGPMIVSLARAKTKMPMYANFIRSGWLVVALIVALLYRDVNLVIWCGVLAELSAVVYAFYYISKKRLVRVRSMLLSCGISLLLVGGIFYLANGRMDGSRPILEISVSLVTLLVIISGYLYFHPMILRILKLESQSF